MRPTYPKATLKTSVLAVIVLLLTASVAVGQTVSLSADRQATMLPDGQTVPMWGYTCLDAGSAGATCQKANPNAPTGWAPPLITVAAGSSLTISLANHLPVNTSLVIVGQVGGGLGATPVREASPRVHEPQASTWPIVGGGAFQPPDQDKRVRSFATEVAPGATNANLVWNNIRPGTYLLETGTYPSIQGPMGLFGVVVVRDYSGATWSVDQSLLLSEIDSTQNVAVNKAVLASASCGTNLLSGPCTGTVPAAVETATPSATNSVSSLTLTSGGSGYTAPPDVVFNRGVGDTTGYGASATTALNLGVASITVGDAGSGYTSVPLVTVDPPPAAPVSGTYLTPPVTALATAVMQVGSISVTNSGQGSYGSATPPVTATVDPPPAGGIQATVTVTMTGNNNNRRVLRVNIVNPGSGYTIPPAIHFSRGNAVAASRLSVRSVNVTTAGAQYSDVPGVNIAAPASGNQATATAALATSGPVGSIFLTNGGSRYTADPTIAFSGGSPGSGAAATAARSFCASSACYPSAVNYDPHYYLVNGVAFSKADLIPSTFNIAATAGSSNSILVRFVNAGLRMHVPSIVGAQSGTASGFSLVAEDGNLLPGNRRVQSEVFLAPGKTYDVLMNAPAADAKALPVFDRALSLSTGNQRDGGMQAFLGVNGSMPAFNAGVGIMAHAYADTYQMVSGNTLTISDPGQGVIANDVGIYGVQVMGSPMGVSLNSDGTFTYSGAVPGSFQYCGNGTSTLCATVSISTCGAGCLEAAGDVTANPDNYTSNVATTLSVREPGVLANDKDTAGYKLTAVYESASGCTVTLNANGSFTANGTAATCTIHYHAQNSQKTSSNSTTATINFLPASNLAVTVVDGKDQTTTLTDYRWIIEEDRTFQLDPTTQFNAGTNVPSLGTSFHASYMPLVAGGCTGPTSCETGQTVLGEAAVCDQGAGVCRTGVGARTIVMPSSVHLDPAKHYYISVLPGDGATPFEGGDSGHTMGGAPIAASAAGTFGPVRVFVEPTPLPTAKVSVFVFEDDSPLNGEVDVHGGTDAMGSAKEPGLGGFEITLFDDAGGTGDATGQMTYDMFNYPLSNALQGMIDPSTGLNACPISQDLGSADGQTGDGMVGMIVTCPAFESDGTTPSPLVGQALIDKMMPGRYGVVATPGASRIGRGEQWLQTNTLDGQKAHDAFLKVGGPGYFQEFGPAGYHVAIGMANPQIINNRLNVIGPGSNIVEGTITNLHYSRPPDEHLYGAGTRDSLGFTQCYVSLGDVDGDDIAFTLCDPDGNFRFSSIPDGTWRITVFDQWNDQIVDGLASAVSVGPNNRDAKLGELSVLQWHTNLYTKTFLDMDGNGIQGDPNAEPGLTLVATNIRFRDGSFSNFNNTDLLGNAGFNEIFPLFSWYVVETDSTRYKPSGIHVIYDAGGKVDSQFGADAQNNPTCLPAGTNCSNTAGFYANTKEAVHLPTSPVDLRVPDALYCDNADCTGANSHALVNPSTGRIDPGVAAETILDATGVACTAPNTPIGCNPNYNKPLQAKGQIINAAEGWQGFSGQNSFIEFGKQPFATNENGGIRGQVIYYSTRPFDDPSLDLQLSWTPGVPHVTVNLYSESTGADGSQTLKLVDTTQTASWDDWAQGFHFAADGTTKVPNMNCPGQSATDPFFFVLNGSTQWLDPNPTKVALPSNSQFKCYDGMHMFNQVQPAVYDGMYQFPSAAYVTAHPNDIPTGGTLVTLPAGKYVVEVIVPPGYELVKEEDKNILIGDNYIAPVTTQFGALGSIFILPDQAALAANSNPNNSQNSTTDQGVQPRHEGDTGSVESFWPCVGENRIVPDFISLFPQSGEVAPFAGATRPLCDRKEITLEDQMTALAKFYIFTPVHVAAHFTGFILDDFSSEFDPYSPQFGEKFAVPNVPISIKNFDGVEVARTYSDQWGLYNGLNYSTWEVNPPNPTGYSPTMMVTCMNDPGSDPAHPDPFYNANYSDFCYEIPFMPGQTQYMDTPVVPTAAFADGYNPPDCSYPDATPAISLVVGNDGVSGPWVSAGGTNHTLTITALGANPDPANPGQFLNGGVQVPNPAYAGPSATAAPYNQKFITRHYGFGTTQGTGTVTIGGVAATVGSWSDTQITVTVPGNVPACGAPLQRTGSGNNTFPASCGELVITAGNGKKSVDSIMVTVGGKHPTYVTPTSITGSSNSSCLSGAGGLSANNAIQTAIDCATPGDLIIVAPGTYTEMVLMWKPVRLQGVGSGSVIINANTHPSGKMDVWRREVNCLFGNALNGSLISGGNPFDPTGTFSCRSGSASDPTAQQGRVDPIPLEAIFGWDANLNGNLAELLQEPTLMGAYEGAGITVLGKGVTNPVGIVNGDDPILLGSSGSACNNNPGNFQCNPSRLDGFSITNSSQGGGGILVHGWNHFLEISNNRVYSNGGTLTGGITIGQVEVPDAVLDASGNFQEPFGYNRNVNVHNNSVTLNASYGDEINSSTPSSAGGVTFCSGADNYHFNNNWVCGNISSGDGGGIAHFGFSYSGDISHNVVLFNQSNNPTLPTYGGGIIAEGVPPDGTFCENATSDVDCAPQLADGVGPNLSIDANLILGNTAESGKGGGLRIQNANGTDVQRNPTNFGGTGVFGSGSNNSAQRWYIVNVTNNIIADNVAGWSGAGVSVQDAVRLNFINNTVASNDATASAGVLFNTDAAAQANVGPPVCTTDPNTGETTCQPILQSTYQPAGLETARHTSNFISAFANGNVSCPTPGAANICKTFSNPVITNDLFWQNRTFHIVVGGTNANIPGLQNTVTLQPTLNQTNVTGACPTGPDAPAYWDIGVYGDVLPAGGNGLPTGANPNHLSGLTLGPRNSALTSFYGSYSGNGNIAPSASGLVRQYCNGSRLNPEIVSTGVQILSPGIIVPPGISDTVLPNPLFFLAPSATPDEGNQWINMSYGPLSLVNGSVLSSGANYNVPLADYSLQAGSAPINAGITPSITLNHDYFNNPRPVGAYDIGAVEFQGAGGGGGGGGNNPLNLPVLDNFNRALAFNLNSGAPVGVSWSQTSLLGVAGIGVADQTPGNTGTGVAASIPGGNAYWNGTSSGPTFGTRQGAAFTFASTPANNTGLVLKATGASLTAPTAYVRVRYTTAGGGTITVATTTNGVAFTTAGTITGFGDFANGDTLTAMVDQNGVVSVWKNATLLLTTPATSFTSTGRIGMQLGGGTLLAPFEVDNFSGGNVP